MIALFLLYRRRKRIRKGLHWVHPIIQKWEEFDAFYTLFGELQDGTNLFFFNYFRMSHLSTRRKRLILRFLNDLRYRHQFRQICWNYPVRELFKVQKVLMYHTSL